MAQRVISYSVELPDEVLLHLLSSGGVAPTSELCAKIGQSIANAGAEFLLGVITRNQPTDREVASRLATVRAALGQAIVQVGNHDAAVAASSDTLPQRAAAISLTLDVGLRIRSALRAEATVAAGDESDGPSVRATAGVEAADRVDRALAELLWLEALAAAAMRRQEAFAAQDAAARAVRRDCSPKVPGSLASVVYPPRVSGARTRRDEVVDRFLWRLWHSHVAAAAYRRAPSCFVRRADQVRPSGPRPGAHVLQSRPRMDWHANAGRPQAPRPAAPQGAAND
jgi:hypothetical protein